ncbi:hypothetical protein EJ02DRAFT_427849 [Clathrospora elynae]|uniref:Tc1-like transposase DDE domain-containing protein n=1 Tax=Clathrospora elynae TaxID=706981 RepID=A0A6A5S853_9PLEO|nr:hypothetical protein EJ02DRAFT_427849 [Clathrospora elynae]
MTQEYYTKELLPKYITAVQCSRMHNTLEITTWQLQEDGDPSHGTKSKDNIAINLKNANWIPLLVHPGSSPDLNPIEGIWLVLKQRTKRRIMYPGDLPQWDGSKEHLKKLLCEV